VIRLNGSAEDYLGETVEALLARLSIGPKGVAVAVNGDVVPRSKWASTTVPDESSVEIVTAVAGG
jgi:sulfur carrier protein